MKTIFKFFTIVVIFLTFSCAGEREPKQKNTDESGCRFKKLKNVEHYTNRQDGTINSAKLATDLSTRFKKFGEINVKFADSLVIINNLIKDSSKTSEIYSRAVIERYNQIVPILCNFYDGYKDTTLTKEYRQKMREKLDSLAEDFYNFIKKESKIVDDVSTNKQNAGSGGYHKKPLISVYQRVSVKYEDGTPAKGKTVVISIGSKDYKAITNEYGVAKVKITKTYDKDKLYRIEIRETGNFLNERVGDNNTKNFKIKRL